MFDLLDRPLLWIPVSWPGLLPPDEPDAMAVPGSHEIEIRVELIDREEAIWRFPNLFDIPEEERDTKRGPTPSAFDTFKRVVSEWRKISANGQKPPMNAKNIKTLLSAPMFEAAFAIAYVSALGGRHMEREKNSNASGNGGQEATKNPPTGNSSETVTASD